MGLFRSPKKPQNETISQKKGSLEGSQRKREKCNSKMTFLLGVKFPGSFQLNYFCLNPLCLIRMHHS